MDKRNDLDNILEIKIDIQISIKISKKIKLQIYNIEFNDDNITMRIIQDLNNTNIKYKENEK